MGTTGPEESTHEQRAHFETEVLVDLVEHGIEVDGEVALAHDTTWLIYGRSTYDGETLLAEFDDQGDAEAALRSIEGRRRSGEPGDASRRAR